MTDDELDAVREHLRRSAEFEPLHPKDTLALLLAHIDAQAAALAAERALADELAAALGNVERAYGWRHRPDMMPTEFRAAQECYAALARHRAARQAEVR